MTSSRSRPTVLVIQAQAKATLPLIESLTRAGVRVALASDERFNCGFYSRGCRERYLHPYPGDRPEEFKAWLLDFLKRRSIAMLFPMGHHGTSVVSQIQDDIRRYTRLLLPEDRIFRAGYEKISTLKAALDAGVDIPDSWFPDELPGGLEEALARIIRWPVLIKPSIGVGARGITWCHDAAEVRAGFPRLAARHGPCFLQDFVPPGGMQYKVDMLVDERQGCLAAVAYGKTRMYPPDGGSSVLNFSTHRPDIVEQAHRVLARLRWVGFADFDFVEDPRDGRVKLMEINPRFPESFRMGTSVGIDFPKMMYDMAHDRPLTPAMHYPANRFVRFLPGDVMWFLRVDRRRRFSTWPSWFRFFGPETAYQICSASDVGPLVGFALQTCATLLNREMRRTRLRLDAGPAARESRKPEHP